MRISVGASFLVLLLVFESTEIETVHRINWVSNNPYMRVLSGHFGSIWKPDKTETYPSRNINTATWNDLTEHCLWFYTEERKGSAFIRKPDNHAVEPQLTSM